MVDPLPTQLTQQIEPWRTKFENDWKRQLKPRIEEVVALLAEPLRSALVAELLKTETALRRGAGESPLASDYAERFADHRALIDQLCSVEACDRTLSIQPGAFPIGRGTPSVDSTRVSGYELGRELHRGGQGVVYEGWQLATRRPVAIKLLLSGHRASVAERRRFEREVDLTAALRHPNIVTLYDSGSTADGAPFLVMELVVGETLEEQIARGQMISLEPALRLFLKICDAVQYAHLRGVIHRDLKPGNILIDGEGEPRILDFGLARPAAEEAVGPDQLTLTGQFLGTLAYASPEQVAGDPAKIDIRTDLYSLGVILYRMLTGAYPYPVIGQIGDILRAIADTPPEPPSSSSRKHLQARSRPAPLAKVDAVLNAIVLKALQKPQAQRYQAAGEFAADVRSYLASEPPLHARPPSMAHLAWRWLRKNTGAAVWAFGIGLMFSFIACFGFMGSNVPLVERSLQEAHDQWFPGLPRPALYLSYSFLPELEPVMLTALTLPFHFLIGLVVVLIVRPRDFWSDVAAGLTAGSAASLVNLVTLGFGLMVALSAVVVIDDLFALAKYASVEGEAGTSQALVDVTALRKKYPDLQQASPQDCGKAVATRVLTDVVVGIERAMWLGILVSFLFGICSCLTQTVIAGFLLRRTRSTLGFVGLYLALGVPGALLLPTLVLLLLSLTTNFGTEWAMFSR